MKNEMKVQAQHDHLIDFFFIKLRGRSFEYGTYLIQLFAKQATNQANFFHFEL